MSSPGSQNVASVLAPEPEWEILAAPSRGSGPLSTRDDWSIERGTIAGGPGDGVQLVRLRNRTTSVEVVPTRGMGLWRAECDGLPLGWQSPVASLTHPRLVNLESRNGLGWLDGFNELLCRCGLAWNGPPGTDDGNPSPIESALTLHGRIANTPAHSVEVSVEAEGGGAISVTGVVDESTLFGPRLRLTSTVRLPLGSRSIEIHDEVTNLGSAPTELQLLYHTNFGPPFLGGGSHIHIPAETIVPRDPRAAEGIDNWNEYLGPTNGYTEQVYFVIPRTDASGNTVALLEAPDGSAGVTVEFSTDQLPCFAVWKCTQATEAGYVTGLEPGTNFPNFKSFERSQGRVISLAPGESHTANLTITAHPDRAAIEEVRGRIEQLQAGVAPQVHDQPALPYCQAAE